MTDEEVMEESNDAMTEIKDLFGYYPIKPLDIQEGVIRVHCPYCNEDVKFKSVEDLKKATKVEYQRSPTAFPDSDPKGNIRYVSNCPVCSRSRARALEDEKIERPLNLKTNELLVKILKEKFGAELKRLKWNLFADPFEVVRFQKGNDKYETKLLTVLAYEDPEGFIYEGSGIEIDEANYQQLATARNVVTGMVTDMDNLLLNENDAIFVFQSGDETSEEASVDDDATFPDSEEKETTEEEKEESESIESEDESESEPTEFESEARETETEGEPESEPTEETTAGDESESDENEFGQESSEPEVSETAESETEGELESETFDESSGESESGENVDSGDETESEPAEEREGFETGNGNDESESESDESDAGVDSDNSGNTTESESDQESGETVETESEEIEDTGPVVITQIKDPHEPEFYTLEEKESQEEEKTVDEGESEIETPESESEIETDDEPRDENEITDDMLESNEDEIDLESETVESDFSAEEALREEKAEEVKEEGTSTEDDDDMTLDLGGDQEFKFPFGDSSDNEPKEDAQDTPEEKLESEVETETEEKEEPEVEEETKDENEINPEDLDETEDDSEIPVGEEDILGEENAEEDEMTLDLGGDKSNSKKGSSVFGNSSSNRYKKNKIDNSGDNDKLRDELNKIKEEENKRWYNNCVEMSDDDIQNGFNEFEDEEDLYNEFMESPFGKVLTVVRQRTNCEGYVLISEQTYEIPFMDFATGVRVICIDTNEEGQLNLPVGVIKDEVPFSFTLPDREKPRVFYLYSDAISTRKGMKATIQNLIKIVNRDNFDRRRIVTLGGKYSLFYTDDQKTIKEFEASNTSYPAGKAYSKMVGLIALKNRGGRKEQQISTKDIMNWISKNYTLDLKSVNLYMVASARYIVKPIHEQQKVEYTIVDYTELGSTILKDGLDRIIAAIVKEHRANRTVYDPKNPGKDFSGYNYTFEFELDQAALPSPSIEVWNDKGGLINLPTTRFEKGKFYIRKTELRQDPKDGWRQDPKLFNRGSLLRRFPKEIATGNINLFSEAAREKFIERMGFMECYYPVVKRLPLNPIEVMKLEFDMATVSMTKIDLTAFFSGSGVYEGGYDNLLMQQLLISKMNDGDENSSNLAKFFMLQSMMGK